MGDAWPSFVDRHTTDLMDAVSSAAELYRISVAPRATLAALDGWLLGSGFNLADPMIEALESAVEIAGDLDLDWPFDPKESWAIVAPYVALACIRCLEEDEDNAPNAQDVLDVFLQNPSFLSLVEPARSFQRAVRE